MSRLKIRKISTHSGYEKCVHIQREVWKHKDIDLLPVHHYCVSVATGAILLGAFLDGKMIGFVYSFPAVLEEKIVQHSHLLAVLPEYRGQKFGKNLKWAQREQALKLGFDRIIWTFDPLHAKNANLNLHTLGGLGRSYLPNFYADTKALALASCVPTDRMLVEWLIKDERVEKRLKKIHKSYDIDEFPRALQASQGENDHFLPASSLLTLRSRHILVEIPRDITRFTKSTDVILKWQNAVRRVLTNYFSRGYRCVDFVLDKNCFYILGKNWESEPG